MRFEKVLNWISRLEDTQSTKDVNSKQQTIFLFISGNISRDENTTTFFLGIYPTLWITELSHQRLHLWRSISYVITIPSNILSQELLILRSSLPTFYSKWRQRFVFFHVRKLLLWIQVSFWFTWAICWKGTLRSCLTS